MHGTMAAYERGNNVETIKKISEIREKESRGKGWPKKKWMGIIWKDTRACGVERSEGIKKKTTKELIVQ